MKNWSNLAQVVYKRTYARKDGGALENWSDTVARVIAGNVKDKGVSLAEIDRLNYFMMERKAIPAGRGLWYSGSPSHYKIGGAALNNCFAGEETFLTKEHGPVSFIETLNETVTVWTKEGWKSAEIKEFGMQKIQNIIFAPTDSDGKKFRSNLRLTKTATPDHGWFLKDGSKTTNLKIGDVVASSKVVVEKDESFVEGLRHGLIFGDGTIANIRSDGSFKFHLRMCDSRTTVFKHLFKDVTYPESYDGDCVGRFDSTENLKQFPKDKAPSYIAGFLEGWIQADGNFSKKTTRLSSQNVDAKEWLIANAPLAGYILTGYSSNNLETNYGTRKNPLYTYTLSQDEVLWKVDSIVELDEEVPVYCAVVEDTHAFTLTGGVYTSNCWFLSGDEIENFVLAMDLLMLGGGVGLSIEHRFTSKLPKVKKDVKVVHTPTKDADFIVPDSREGWGELFRRTLDAFFVTGKSFSYSTVCVRGYGEKIEGFGGTASGPQPLVKFIDTVSSILVQREGRHIRPIDAMDVICCTGEMVVAGNVRRSAIIILGDAFDKEYLKSKRWDLGQVPTYRAFANLSIVLDDIEDAHPLFWKTYENGEPFGIVNRKNIQMYARMGEKKKDTAIGVNPCVTGETQILTDDGYRRIDECLDTPVTVWNGFEWSEVQPKITGTNQDILNVTFSDGRVLSCTPYHKFHISTDYRGATKIVEAKDLEIGMKLIKCNFPVIEHGAELKNAYTNGFVAAEGMELCDYIQVYKPKEVCIPFLEGVKKVRWQENNNRFIVSLSETPQSKKFVPVNYNLKSKLQWLAGLFDGDATCPNNNGIQLCSVDREFLSRVQIMLTTVGINSKVRLMRTPGVRLMPDGKGGKKEYFCQEAYRLLVPASQAVRLWEMGMVTHRISKPPVTNRDCTNLVQVSNISEGDMAETVYCFNEPKRHLGIFNGVITGQCAEATLESGEPCNLQEIALANIKDENEFVEAAVLMHRYGKRVTMESYHHQKITNVILKNRRIGTGITGCLESPLFNPESLDRAYKAIQQENLKYSKELGIPESIRTTVVKPSGTVSKLLDQKGEGIHAAYSEYMIQRVRFGANDPLIPLLKAAGHYMEPVVRFDGTFDHNTLVVDFYLKAPNGMPCADKDFDTWKQLDVLMMAQKYWADQAVSVTVYYKREELLQIKEWLSNNLKYLKTISFLCHSEHGFKQAPKEAMSKEEYEKRSSKIKELVFDDNQSTNVELADLGLECAGGVCPIR